MDNAVAALVIGVVIWLIARGKSEPRQISNQLAMLPERFVVFDLETTGLKAERHEIIEIGAILVKRDHERHETFQTLIKPKSPLPQRITDLTGINQRMVDLDGTELSLALAEFRAFVSDLPMVSYNAEFDVGFLHAACEAADCEPFPNEMICALKLARQAWPKRKSYRLAALAKDGNLAGDNEHRALGDCRRTVIVFAAAVQALGRYR